MTHKFGPPYWIIACIITIIIYFFCLFLLAFNDQRNKITEDVSPVVIDMSEAVEITSEEFRLHSQRPADWKILD